VGHDIYRKSIGRPMWCGRVALKRLLKFQMQNLIWVRPPPEGHRSLDWFAICRVCVSARYTARC